jgi:hypothetical protein
VKIIGQGLVLDGHSAIGIAFHVELAIILMSDAEAEPFVEPQSRIDFHNGQAHRLIETCGLANQATHHLGSDTLPLKRTIHEELRNKKPIILRCALQPTDVRIVDGDDADLLQRPLFAEKDLRAAAPRSAEAIFAAA